MHGTYSPSIPKLPKIFYCYPEDTKLGVHNLVADETCVMLVNSIPDRTWTTPDQVPEIPAVNGYPKGGLPILNKYLRNIKGKVGVMGDMVVFRAVGGQVGPFCCAVVYNKTKGKLICYFEHVGEDDIVPGQWFPVSGGDDGWFTGV